MKKILMIFVAAVLMASMLVACSPGGEAVSGQDKLQIVTTVFPEYDWVMNVLKDKADSAEVTLLLDSGVDLHNYQPTADDMLKISSCDLFIYVGGESDEWVEDALSEAVNKDMAVINLLETLGDKAKEEEHVEGMEEEAGHDHGGEKHDKELHDGEEHDKELHDGDEHDEETHEEDGHGHGGEGTEYDEHVWLSMRNAAQFVDVIAGAISVLDPVNADDYKKNAADYKAELEALDARYKDAMAAAGKKTLLFGDRFPFRYLVDDHGLDYYAAFAGCSAETEASFETIIFLAKKVDELSLGSIMTIDGSDQKIAETIRENTKSKDQKILTLDSMQSTTKNDVENGSSYISIMEKNLEVLKEALGD